MTLIHPETQSFLDILDEMRLLSLSKQSDYGKLDSPFANIRGSEDFGIPSWIGCGIRINDKVRRIQKASILGPDAMKHDSTEDDFLDIAVYSGIGLHLFRDWSSQNR